MKYILFLIHLSLLPGVSIAGINACQPLLWPDSSAIMNTSLSVSPTLITKLQQASKKLLHQRSAPIRTLGSSGKTNINNPLLIASRKALQDADSAALLAITYHLTHETVYLNKVTEILTNWSIINQPTGHPIDETRLDGMIWAYDLVACDLSNEDRIRILTWFKKLHTKKTAWKFTVITSQNNYRIHQLKMLLLLDKVLQRNKDWQQDIKIAEKYSTINLDAQSGKSIDYIERTALYYHNYVMQPWLEICLITDNCWPPIKQAFAWLSYNILSHHTGNEFSNSTADIDERREQGGFEYAVKGGTFDETKCAPTIVTYYTIIRSKPAPNLWRIQKQSKPSPKMTFLRARRMLWHP